MSIIEERPTLPTWWVDGFCVEATDTVWARAHVRLLHEIDVDPREIRPWPSSNVDAPYLDVWLRIPDGEEEAEAEANTRRSAYGYTVDWSLTAVGLVTSVHFSTHAEAQAWLTAQGFDDYTVNE